MSAEDEAFLEWLEREHSGDVAARLQEAARIAFEKGHHRQQEFISDPFRFKAILAPRRVGKTKGIALYLAKTTLEKDDAQARYVTDTRDHAKKLMWDELLDTFRELGIAVRTNVTELMIELPNRSKIYLGGAETEADIEKYRGFKNSLFVIDEAASIKHLILDALITRIILPSLVDVKGTLCLTGTPGHVLAGTFYDVTGPSAREGWHVYRWGLKDNTAVPHLEAEMLAMKARMGWGDQHPTWIREGCGRWAADDDRLVFKFNPELNLWAPSARGFLVLKELPQGHRWRLLIGMDMGFHDPFALQVFAYSSTNPCLYQVYEYQEKYLTPPKIAAKIKEILQGLKEVAKEDLVDGMIADYSGLGGESLREQFLQEYGLLINAAERKDKRDHIELFNGDLVDGRLKLLVGSNLVNEILYLSWDDTGLKEKAGMANHNADAAVYIWRLSQHRFYITPVASPTYGTQEWERQRSVQEDRQAEEYARRLKSTGDDWDTMGFDEWT